MSVTNHRTAIESLKIRGFRSIKEVALTALPEIVVLLGQNGAGKSNILRAARLGCRVMSRWEMQTGPDRDPAAFLGWQTAAEALQVTREDFHRPDASEIRITTRWTLGTRQLRALKLPGGLLPEGPVSLEYEVVLEDEGPAGLLVWVDRAFLVVNSATTANSQWVQSLDRTALPGFEEIPNFQRRLEGLAPHAVIERQELSLKLSELRGRNAEWSRFASRLTRDFLGQRAIATSEAYRTPDTRSEAQELFRRFVSPDPEVHDSIKRLQRLLGEARLFPGASGPVEIRPVQLEVGSDTKIPQIRIRHPVAGELPLEHLGSGEQQLVLLLAQRVISVSPVIQIEEPEAHLHVALMRSFAQLLLAAVRPVNAEAEPDIEQLWLATHHHLFALHERFHEVTIVNGETRVEEKNRAQAAIHFYEPGALWGALQSLMQAGLPGDTIVFCRDDGRGVTAKEIQDSERGDRAVFTEWATRATEQVVLAMKTRARASPLPKREGTW